MRHGQHGVLPGRHARREQPREVEGPGPRQLHGLALGGARRGGALRAEERGAGALLARAQPEGRRGGVDVVDDLRGGGMKIICYYYLFKVTRKEFRQIFSYS